MNVWYTSYLFENQLLYIACYYRISNSSIDRYDVRHIIQTFITNIYSLSFTVCRLVERGEYNNGFAAEGADLSSRRVSGAKTFRLILDQLISTIGVESLKEVSKNRLTLTYRGL